MGEQMIRLLNDRIVDYHVISTPKLLPVIFRIHLRKPFWKISNAFWCGIFCGINPGSENQKIHSMLVIDTIFNY